MADETLTTQPSPPTATEKNTADRKRKRIETLRACEEARARQEIMDSQAQEANFGEEQCAQQQETTRHPAFEPEEECSQQQHTTRHPALELDEPVMSVDQIPLRLFNTGEFADIQLNCQQDRVYLLHKAIVCFQSKWFMKRCKAEDAPQKERNPHLE